MATLARYRTSGTMHSIATLSPDDQPLTPLSAPSAIRACRKGRLTQDELAAATGIGQSTISQWEVGKSAPDLNQVRAIEEACDRPAGWIAVQAGLVALPTTVPEMIAVDPALDDDHRSGLLAGYRGAISKVRAIRRAADDG